MPGALAAVHALGVGPPGQAFHGIRYGGSGRSADASFRAGPGRGIRRTTLPRALREAALDAGARIEQRAVRALTQDSATVTADGVRARHLVAADGPVPEGELAGHAAALLERFPSWAKNYRSEDGAARLAADAVEVLCAFKLAAREGPPDAVAVRARPAAARFAVAAPVAEDSGGTAR